MLTTQKVDRTFKLPKDDGTHVINNKKFLGKQKKRKRVLAVKLLVHYHICVVACVAFKLF